MPESSSDSNNVSPEGDPIAVAPASDENLVESQKKSRAFKIAGALSTVLWIVGFILPFVLKKGSPYVWISDTFLLTGFWPLLFYNRSGWTWLVFGILNMVVGFGLEVVLWLVPAIPESLWTPERMALKPWFTDMHHHIANMHPSLPWIIIGALSTIYGIFRVVKTIIRWTIKRTRKSTR